MSHTSMNLFDVDESFYEDIDDPDFHLLKQHNPRAYWALIRLRNTNRERINHLFETGQMKMVAKANKNGADFNYYVGQPALARQINGNGGYVTSFNDAVATAKQKLRETDQPQIVVKIVAVVEHVEKPVRVRKVK